nr:GDP-mannose 4,6-dehydratase [uncultured Dongia sp.]
MVERILVMGGSGFIGSAMCRLLVETTQAEIVNLDKLTYAASPAACAGIVKSPRYCLVVDDVADGALVEAVCDEFHPQWIFNLAAESHVDRSIDAPEDFIATNVVGTLRLPEAAKNVWRKAPDTAQRFIQVSTDEMFGSLGDTGLQDPAPATGAAA